MERRAEYRDVQGPTLVSRPGPFCAKFTGSLGLARLLRLYFRPAWPVLFTARPVLLRKNGARPIGGGQHPENVNEVHYRCNILA
jgi:hypothetical protein